jgi:hypothetical protein
MRRLLMVTGLVFAVGAGSGKAVVVFEDDFESGSLLPNWNVASGTAFTIDNTMNAVPAGGTFSALDSSTAQRMYHSLDYEADGTSSFTVWIYDNGVTTRAIAQVHAFVGPFSPANVGLQQCLGIGKYNGVTMPGEVWDGSYYQGRVLYPSATMGWFNLNAPGAVERSPGWHKFTILRRADNTTINFYVDGVLGRTISGAKAATWDSVTLGLGAGSTAGNCWYDGVQITESSPAEQITDLSTLVQSLGLSPGIENSLLVKLGAAQLTLDNGVVVATCGTLQAFILEVVAQAGKREITEAQADLLIEEATWILVALGCL